jgi:catechol 2,3-dioxygenase-like lactoylglutathione lyase family enzyme
VNSGAPRIGAAVVELDFRACLVATKYAKLGARPQGGAEMAAFRYLVNDVEEAIAFYTRVLGFDLEKQFGAAMAIVKHGDLQLWLAGPEASAARPMPDGRKPEPGGWNRIVLVVPGMDPVLKRLDSAMVRRRSEVVSGPGGRQLLIEDPSGNPVELFEPV